jgi:filamentous hemagglutinin family protein
MRSPRFLFACLGSSFVALLATLCDFPVVAPVIAQVVPDQTLLEESSVVTPAVEVSGEQADLIEGGAVRGPNVFHSFSEFNIGDSERVFFSSPAGIDTILGRVTGNGISTIQGTLGTTGASQAALIFINPNGIVFEGNARLDVQGAFTAVTADGVYLGEQGLFSATDPSQDNLLAVQPSAFFFSNLADGNLSNNLPDDGDITIAAQGAAQPLLAVPDGEVLQLIGSNIFAAGGSLESRGGSVELAAVREAEAVAISGNSESSEISLKDSVERGNILFENAATINVQQATDGDIRLWGDDISLLSGSQLTAGIAAGLGGAGSQAGDVRLDATGRVTLSGSGTALQNNLESGATGNAGNIFVVAENLDVVDDSRLRTNTQGIGNAGNIQIQVEETARFDNSAAVNIVTETGIGEGGNIQIDTNSLALTNGAQLNASTGGIGDAGDVVIQAQDTAVFEGIGADGISVSSAFSQVESGAQGNGGEVSIQANSVRIAVGAKLDAATFGNGNAGNVSIQAQDSVIFDGGDAFTSVSSTGVGEGGNIQIAANSLSVVNGGQLVANTLGVGDAGDIAIRAQDAVVFDGTSADGSFASGALSTVEAGAQGNGGDISIEANSFRISNNGGINVSTLGAGNAGNVAVRVREDVVLEGSSADGNAASSIGNQVGVGAQGNGGEVKIEANSLLVSGGARINSATLGTGNAGNIVIQAEDAVVFEGTSADGRLVSAAITGVGQNAAGNGGDIRIEASSLRLSDGASLEALTLGGGNAGNIVIQVQGEVLFEGRSENGILSSGARSDVFAGAEGNGGEIRIEANSLLVSGGAEISADTLGAGDAGSIVILAEDAVVFEGGSDNGRLASSATTFTGRASEGNGGEIRIEANSLRLSDGAVLTTSTFSEENAGNIVIQVLGEVLFEGRGEDGIQSSGTSSSVFLDAEGNGGDVKIEANSLLVSGGAQISASTFGIGDAGNIVIQAEDAVVFEEDSENGRLASSAITAAGQGSAGSGGDIRIEANSLRLSDGAFLETATAAEGDAGGIVIQAEDTVLFEGRSEDGTSPSATFSNVLSGAGGNGGDVSIEANSLSVSGGARINASTLGAGDAGNIVIQAEDAVVFEGTSADGRLASSAITAAGQGSAGNGGDIRIEANSLRLSDGAFLETATAAEGDAGGIVIQAEDTVLFEGRSEDGTSPSATFSNVLSGAGGNGGDVSIEANSLFVSEGARINASTFGIGDAGNIVIQAEESVVFEGASEDGKIVSAANTFAGQGSEGNGGDIGIEANSLRLSNGGRLEASTEARGNAGDIVIQAEDEVLFEGRSENGALFSGIRSSALSGSEGSGGDVSIEANNLRLRNGALIAAESIGSGRAGNMQFSIQDRLELQSSAISTVSEFSPGGQIQIASGAVILRENSDITTFVFSGENNGGDLTIVADAIVALEDSDILTLSLNGQGGNIDLSQTTLFSDPLNIASGELTESELPRTQNNGAVDINASGGVAAGEISINNDSLAENELAELPDEIINIDTLVASSCIAYERGPGRSSNETGRLTVTGRDHLPQGPSDVTSSAYPTGTVQTVSPEQTAQIVEPSSIYQLPDGRLIMSRDCERDNSDQ